MCPVLYYLERYLGTLSGIRKTRTRNELHLGLLFFFLSRLYYMKLLTVLSKQLYNDMSHICHTSIFTTLLNCESQLKLPRKKSSIHFNNRFSLFSVFLAARKELLVLLYANGNQNRMKLIYTDCAKGEGCEKLI